MAAETLPGWFTACRDLQSSNSVLLIRQEKREKEREGAATSSAVPAPRLALELQSTSPQSCAQRTSAELKFISWEHLCHSRAQYDYLATSSVLKTVTLCDCRANAKMFTS